MAQLILKKKTCVKKILRLQAGRQRHFYLPFTTRTKPRKSTQPFFRANNVFFFKNLKRYHHFYFFLIKPPQYFFFLWMVQPTISDFLFDVEGINFDSPKYIISDDDTTRLLTAQLSLQKSRKRKKTRGKIYKPASFKKMTQTQTYLSKNILCRWAHIYFVHPLFSVCLLYRKGGK